MAQIQRGWTYQTGDSVTADNLNALVGGAQLQAEAITGQPAIASVTGSTQILATNGGSLSKATVDQIITGANLFDKSQAQTLNNNVTFANGADVTLSSSSVMSLAAGAQITLSSNAILTLGQDPTLPLQAVPKQYVDNGFLSKTGGQVSGSISMIGTSSILTLSADPVQPLQAATKQYADKSGLVKAWVNFNATGTTPSIRASFNVSSVIETALSDRYQVNFTTPMQDSSYCVNVTSANESGDNGQAWGLVATSSTVNYATAVTASYVRVGSYAANTGFRGASIFVSIIR